MSSRSSLLVSISLHALLLWTLLSRPIAKPPKDDRIEFEIQESPKAAPSGRSSTSRVARRSRPPKSSNRLKGASLPGLAQLKPADTTGVRAGHFAPDTWTSDPFENGWSAEHWGAGGGDFKQVEHDLKFQKLQTEVKGLLFYTGALGRREISGTIHARLRFAADGGCDWPRTRIEGAQPYLRVYILTLLKKLCALETTRRIGFREHQTVDLSFAFTIAHAQHIEQGHHDRINGNVLFFERFFPSSILEYKLGPIRGVWFAPVVYLDFPWIFENYDRLVHGVDPLDEFRE